jgi:acetyl esterase
MPLDPSAKRFLERLAKLNPPSVLSLTVAERRKALQDLLSFAGTAAPIGAVEELSLPGPAGPLGARLYTPVDAPQAQLPGLIYFHGGGLVAGTLDTHDAICRSLANASGCRLISVDYRLAPEHPFPAAVEDGCAAVRWIGAHAGELEIDSRRLGICGDSAGATLATVVCRQVLAGGEVRLAMQFLLCPIMDFCADTDSRRRYAEGYLLDRATLEHDLRHYLGPDADPADPRVSPLRARGLEALPPTCIHTAECDPLRDEARAYAQRAEREGIKTLYRCHSGMIHLFYGMGGILPHAADAYRAMGADIRSMLG